MLPMGIVMLMSAPVYLSSCGGDDDSPSSSKNDPVDDDDGDGGTTTTPISVTEQKQFLEKTAREMMGKVSASDFQSIKNLAKFINAQYIDNDSYNHDALDDWAKECLDASLTLTGSDENNDNYYQSITKYYHAVWTVSNFTGHFTAGTSKWTYEKANDLQFSFKNGNGKDCMVKVTTSGDTFKLSGSLLDYEDDDWAYSYDYATGTSTNTRTYSIYKNEIYVPEQVVVSVTEDGKSILNADVHLAYQGNGELNLNSDVLTVSAKIQLNDYTFDVQKVKAQNAAQSEVNFVFSKNNEQLMSVKATGVVTGNEERLTHVGEGTATVDLLGKVQLKANCVDGSSVNDYLEKAYDANSFDSFKSLVNQAKNQVNGTMYFNGNATVRATLGIECFEESNYYGQTFSFQPVWSFADGSSVNFTNYFDEGTFNGVINTAEGIWKDFESLFEW